MKTSAPERGRTLTRGVASRLGSLAFASMTACAPVAPSSDVPPAPVPGVASVAPEGASEPLPFSCTDLEGKPVSTTTVAGRVTVILFFTSYDPASVAEAQFLRDLTHTHAPRINAVGMVLEQETNRPLVQGFADGTKLGYPVCLADADTIAGHGTFAGMNAVPSVLILDREGRPRYRYIGLQKAEALEAAIASVE